MAFEYFEVEDLIVAALADCSSLFFAMVIPDNQADFKSGFPKAVVTVAFAGGKSLGNTATDIVRYEEELTVVCNIRSKSLRGEEGCHHICNLLKARINGLKVQGKQLVYQDYQPSDPLRDAENKTWAWDLSFTLRKIQVQETIPEEDPLCTYRDLTGQIEYENQQPS